MQTLKPCPFCLSENTEIKTIDTISNDSHSEYVVQCMNCGAFGPNDLSKKLANESWNLRRIEHPKEIKLVQFFELRKRQPDRGIVEVWNQVFNTPANNAMNSDQNSAA